MWEWNEDRGQFYLHQYVIQQPDLNLRNPDVMEDMLATMQFWLDKGADGFRMDAVPMMFEDERFLDEPKSETAPPDTPPEEYAYWDHPYTYNQPEVLPALTLFRVLNDIYGSKNGSTGTK